MGASSLLLTYFYTPIALGIAALSPIVLYYIAGPAYVSGQYALIVVMIDDSSTGIAYVNMDLLPTVR